MAAQVQPKATSSWAVDPSHTTVEFAVRHMVITTVQGRFSKFDVDLDFDPEHTERSKMVARIDTASLDTREAQRDAHLRSQDFFYAEKFPQMTFASKRVEPTGEGRYRMVGDLTIRDVTREVALDVEFAGFVKDPWGNQRAGFSAQGDVSRKEWGLNWNLALEAGGSLVGDTVKIAIETELVKKPTA